MANDQSKKLALSVCESGAFTIADVPMKTQNPESLWPKPMRVNLSLLALERHSGGIYGS
jgi:hypothetical protein